MPEQFWVVAHDTHAGPFASEEAAWPTLEVWQYSDSDVFLVTRPEDFRPPYCLACGRPLGYRRDEHGMCFQCHFEWEQGGRRSEGGKPVTMAE